MRTILLEIGFISVVFGVVGIFLPVLPTTPFLLLAAAAFLRSSDKAYQWLINHPYLGNYVRNYYSGKGIPRKAKITAITMVWLTLGLSIHFVIKVLAVRILLACIGAGVTVYLLSLPTYTPDS